MEGFQEVSYAHVMEYIPLPSAENMVRSHQHLNERFPGSITLEGIVRVTESSLAFLPSDHGHSSWTQW